MNKEIWKIKEATYHIIPLCYVALILLWDPMKAKSGQ